jgi:hypothetical protein
MHVFEPSDGKVADLSFDTAGLEQFAEYRYQPQVYALIKVKVKWKIVRDIYWYATAQTPTPLKI